MDLRKELRKYFGLARTKKTFYTDIFIMVLITITCITFILETYDLPQQTLQIMKIIDTIILSLFTVEIGIRYWVAKDKKIYFKSRYTWIDIIVVLPFLVGQSQLQFFRILRVFRMMRYLEKYFSLSRVNDEVSLEKLFFIRVAFILFAIFFISSSLFYIIESPINPKVDNFEDSLYFVVSTVTTVGFGDITPVSREGIWATILIIISGVMLIPYHLGLLIKHSVILRKKKHVTCKSCGLKHHDPDAVFCKACGAKIFQEHDG